MSAFAEEAATVLSVSLFALGAVFILVGEASLFFPPLRRDGIHLIIAGLFLIAIAGVLSAL